jgi:probable rRNA maturation factor
VSRPASTLRTVEAYGGLDITVSIEDEAWAVAPFAADADALEAFLRRAVEAAFVGAGIDPAVRTELGVTLTGDDEVRALNAEWRGKDKPTNVLSFPLADLGEGETPGPMLGDLVLARQTVLAESAFENKAPADHLCHLVVHGTLHCLGYDHIDAGDAEAMEALEIAILNRLGIDDPYLLPDDGEGEPLADPKPDPRS